MFSIWLRKSKKMSTVYIPNHAGHDYSGAAKFGSVKVITEGRLEKFKLHEFSVICLNAMKDSEEDDYVLISGLASVCAVACSIQSHRFGKLNILVYRGDRYVEYNFNFTSSGGRVEDTD